VRVSVHGYQGFLSPEPAHVVIMTGHLSPPSGHVEPSGFDFQRLAWFEGLGAVGYTRNPVLLGADAGEGDLGLWIYTRCVTIRQAVRDRLASPSGAFAAAIITGDRSAMDRDSLDALRASNLVHLLAISGMHMGILAAFIFAMVRTRLAFWPTVALRWPVKKIAAAIDVLVAAAHLAMSGAMCQPSARSSWLRSCWWPRCSTVRR
jgi:competence protein ComEC